MWSSSLDRPKTTDLVHLSNQRRETPKNGYMIHTSNNDDMKQCKNMIEQGRVIIYDQRFSCFRGDINHRTGSHRRHLNQNTTYFSPRRHRKNRLKSSIHQNMMCIKTLLIQHLDNVIYNI